MSFEHHQQTPTETFALGDQDAEERRLGLVVLSAEALSEPAEAIPPYTVPSPEQTADTYASVVSRRKLIIPNGMDLGLVLARIPPDRQSLFRAIHGMFPFDRKYTHAELAELRGVSEPAIYSMAVRTYSALKNGTENYQKNNPRTQISLETLAREILENRHNLQPHELDLLQQINGLPPYFMPLGPSEIAQSLDVSRSAITLRERTAAQKLFGHIPAVAHPLRGAPSKDAKGEDTLPAQSKMNRPKKPRPSSIADAEQRRKLFRARDAGWYAGMLHSLHAEESREYWAETIRRELGRAAVVREGMRNRMQSHPTPLRGVLGGVALTGEEPTDPRALLDTRRAFNPEYDTPKGQEQIVQNLIARTQEHTADLADLETIMDEGMEAQKQLLEDNITLVFFIAHRLDHNGKKYGRKFSSPDLSAGYKGLREAVQRFDDSLGFAFSTYAAKMIAGRILQARTRDRAVKRGVSVPILVGLQKIQDAESDLLQELQRSPTTEEIAKKAKLPDASAVEKILAAVDRADARSLDRMNEGKRSLNDSVGSLDPEIERIESADALAGTFQEVFRESKLSDMEQRILLGMFGIASAEKTEQELAQELGIEAKEVLRLFRRAKNKIAKSIGAHKLLRGYVEQVA
jgi:RNA polymerase sigma-B factor